MRPSDADNLVQLPQPEAVTLTAAEAVAACAWIMKLEKLRQTVLVGAVGDLAGAASMADLRTFQAEYPGMAGAITKLMAARDKV